MLKYPTLREELMQYLHIMADRELAYQTWVCQKTDDASNQGSFTDAIGFFFDYTSVGRKEQSIGWIVKNEKEYEAVCKLMSRMNSVLQKVGGGYAPDIEYLQTEEWNSVIEAAKGALHIFES